MSQRENADRTQALVMLSARGVQTVARDLCQQLLPTTQYYKASLSEVVRRALPQGQGGGGPRGGGGG